jgi:peroxiredoxin
MAITPSNMRPIGTQLPTCILPDTRQSPNHEMIDLAKYADKQPLLVAFICNHCPFVLHLIEPWVSMMTQLQAQGLACVAICSNDPITYPADAPEKMTEFASKHHFTFPYCFDKTQKIASTFHAACTPDFFLFDHNHQLAYRGRFDSSTPGNDEPLNGKDLHEAISAVLNHQPCAKNQKPSMGCNIKWRSEPTQDQDESTY